MSTPPFTSSIAASLGIPTTLVDLPSNDLILYSGGCHCQSLRFKCYGPKNVTIYNCNCTICDMRQNEHFIIPKSHFCLIEKQLDNIGVLKLYTFNTHQAKHLFCNVCGILSFYIPRSNPDGIAITLRCLDNWKDITYKRINFDGQNWEESYNNSSISNDSKVNEQ